MAQDLIGRVQRLLLSPKTEWDAIDRETVDPQSLVVGYVAPLAAIPAVATIIGMGIIGVGSVRLGFGTAIGMALTQFVMTIVMVFVFAFIINALAPTFGAQKNFNQALKVTAYYPTAVWVAGIFMIIPMLGILGLVGLLYSLYLLFVGLPKLMKPPAEKATTYTIVSIVVAIVAGVIIAGVTQAFTPKPTISFSSSSSTSTLQKRADALEAAAESGDMNAALGALAGLAGGDPNAPVVDGAALEKLAPQRVAGLKRESLSVESVSMPFKAVVMTAKYGDGDKTVELRVTNSAAISAMLGIAGLAGAESNRTTDDGYERVYREDGETVVEEWSKSREHGRYGRSVAGSFLIEAEGDGVDMKALENAVKEFKESELKKLPKAG